jgi:hypothetical protein
LMSCGHVNATGPFFCEYVVTVALISLRNFNLSPVIVEERCWNVYVICFWNKLQQMVHNWSAHV